MLAKVWGAVKAKSKPRDLHFAVGEATVAPAHRAHTLRFSGVEEDVTIAHEG